MRVNINATIPLDQMNKLNQLVHKFGVPRSVVAERMVQEYINKRFNANGTIKRTAEL